MIDPTRPTMMPGQEPYSPADLDRLYAAVSDAGEGDPGEGAEHPEGSEPVECETCGTEVWAVLDWDVDGHQRVFCSPACREEDDAIRARYRAAQPPVCPDCYRPGPPCPERDDGRCRHCHAQATDIILAHYHPYRATDD